MLRQPPSAKTTSNQTMGANRNLSAVPRVKSRGQGHRGCVHYSEVDCGPTIKARRLKTLDDFWTG